MNDTLVDRPEVPSSDGAVALKRGLESIFLLAVCGVLFFLGMGRFDFIKTEGLRAIVVAEMLERPGLTMPTVHHVPQLKKPPLYAWTTTVLARAMGRFDEQVARLPSGIAGTMLVLLLYVAAEWLIGRHAGLAAAAFALSNTTLIDYSSRAELDMGFTLLTTVALLLSYAALRRTGITCSVCWLACYLVATVAAMWKGPHSLMFLWGTLFAYAGFKRQWRRVLHPAHVVGALLSLAFLAGWAVVLSESAGTANVARTAGIELVSRLIPLSLKSLLSVLYALPVMAVVILPASAFVLVSLRSGIVYRATDRPAGNSIRALLLFVATRARRWWQALAVDPFAEFLLFWFVANAAWSIVVPAKAPRYWLPMFPPVMLLAALILRPRPDAAAEHLRTTWRCVFGVLGVVGTGAGIAALASVIQPELSIAGASLGDPFPWVVLATCWLTLAIIGVSRRVRLSTAGCCIGLIAAAVACKPLLTDVWWPARASADSQRASAARIDRIVPPGEFVFVLGRHELPDVAFYSRRPFQWLDEPGDAGQYTASSPRYYLLRSEDLEACVRRLDLPFQVELEFPRADKMVSLIRMDSPVRHGVGELQPGLESAPVEKPG